MTTAPAKKTRQMPKGGRKGGTAFPRVPLAEVLVYAKKLVSKTHTGPQSRDVVLMGVIGSKHDKGEIGMSALRHYGLLAGDTKSNFTAEELARKIAAAPPEELTPLYRQAALKPAVFKALFETFHSDTVSKARLKQRAADLKVHPDETGNCVELYVSSMATAELVTVEGEQVTHVASADAAAPRITAEENGAGAEEVDEEPAAEGFQSGRGGEAMAAPGEAVNGAESQDVAAQRDSTGHRAIPRAVFNVNVTLDASLDVEKLEKQLALLKRYGAL